MIMPWLPVGLFVEYMELSRRWEKECNHWRGTLLYGKNLHLCDDWDGLPTDSTCHEQPCGCWYQHRHEGE